MAHKKETHPNQTDNCENCGGVDEIEHYEFVLDGITLCGDCADLPVKHVKKNPSKINWVKVNGEYFPPNYPVVKNNG